MDESTWRRILSDINKENAVLLLGHGFLPHAHEALNGMYAQELDGGVKHFYRRDGLFLFSNMAAKTIAQEEAARFFEMYRPDESLLQKIAELPFRLIISANPDKSLFNTFHDYGIPIEFDYFSSKPKGKKSILESPSSEAPLLYNLCGSFEDEQSLILDYDDLFDLLTELLKDSNVPGEGVKIPLQKAKTYIFLGFHFERWYTQIFLRYLNQFDKFRNNSNNYVLKTTFKNPDAQKFFVEQFNVKFIGADEAFLNELHHRFSTSEQYRDKMRQLRKPDALTPLGHKVFISYNHHDRYSADRVVAHLRENGFAVTIDHEALPGGSNIEDWITLCLRTHDFVISLVSENSLKSGWVGTESKQAYFAELLRERPLRFVALGLEQDVFGTDFRRNIFQALEAKISQLKNQVIEDLQKERPTEDLQSQLNRLIDHRNNLGKILDRLQQCKTIDATVDNFGNAMNELVEALQPTLQPLNQ